LFSHTHTFCVYPEARAQPLFAVRPQRPAAGLRGQLHPPWSSHPRGKSACYTFAPCITDTRHAAITTPLYYYYYPSCFNRTPPAGPACIIVDRLPAGRATTIHAKRFVQRPDKHTPVSRGTFRQRCVSFSEKPTVAYRRDETLYFTPSGAPALSTSTLGHARTGNSGNRGSLDVLQRHRSGP